MCIYLKPLTWDWAMSIYDWLIPPYLLIPDHPKPHKTFQLAILALVATAALASPDAPPAYGPPPTYADVPPLYNYAYAVADDYSQANFAASEQRDGYATSGSYRVNLPDGRVQVVTYTADQNGYVADVKYEGVAQSPEYKPAPAYKPAY